jgi:hypothetical protein
MSKTKQAITTTSIQHETTWDGRVIAQIVKAQPHDPFELRAKERALAGTYRVIHGTIEIPRPDRLNEDGSEKTPKSISAIMGDHIELGDDDAARMIDAGVVERLDAKPSRVGKVWEPPPVIEENIAARLSKRAARA